MAAQAAAKAHSIRGKPGRVLAAIRRCSGCKQRMPIDDFAKNRGKPGGRSKAASGAGLELRRDCGCPVPIVGRVGPFQRRRGNRDVGKAGSTRRSRSVSTQAWLMANTAASVRADE